MRTRFLPAVVALALVAALALTACGEEQVLVSPPGDAGLPGSRWVVTAFTLDGVGGALPAGIRLTLDFDDADGAGGTAGCNSYFATFALTAGGITFTGIGSTEMACAPDVMEREQRFLAALGRVTGFSLEAERLALTSADGTVAIDLVPFVPEPDRPLAGTQWRLTTFVDGEVASSTVADSTVTLSVDDLAGTISGNGGCNSFGGQATFGDGTVTIGDLISTEMACDPAIMDQEATVFEVLGAATTWEIDGTTLRITAPDGRALEFAAD
jgi:heat shock protein HslJ